MGEGGVDCPSLDLPPRSSRWASSLPTIALQMQIRVGGEVVAHLHVPDAALRSHVCECTIAPAALISCSQGLCIILRM